MLKFAEHLSKEQIRKVNQLRHTLTENNRKTEEFVEVESKNNKSKEDFSRWEIEELMGSRRETFKRVRGAIRRR